MQDWERESERNERYLESISRFPVPEECQLSPRKPKSGRKAPHPPDAPDAHESKSSPVRRKGVGRGKKHFTKKDAKIKKLYSRPPSALAGVNREKTQFYLSKCEFAVQMKGTNKHRRRQLTDDALVCM